MLGFNSISENSISSVKGLTFFIRGKSSISINLEIESNGVSYIIGNSNTVLSLNGYGFAHINLNRSKKQFKIRRTIKEIYSIQNNPKLLSSIEQKSITPLSPTKDLDVSSSKYKTISQVSHNNYIKVKKV